MALSFVTWASVVVWIQFPLAENAPAALSASAPDAMMEVIWLASSAVTATFPALPPSAVPDTSLSSRYDFVSPSMRFTPMAAPTAVECVDTETAPV